MIETFKKKICNFITTCCKEIKLFCKAMADGEIHERVWEKLGPI